MRGRRPDPLDAHEGVDADLDREIAALVAVDPSPDFRVGVRKRLADRPVPLGFRAEWLLGCACAATVAVVLLAIAFSSREHEARVNEPMAATGGQQAEVPAAAPSALTEHEPTASTQPIRLLRTRRRELPVLRVDGLLPPVEILIAPDEAKGLKLLLAEARGGITPNVAHAWTDPSPKEAPEFIEAIAISRIMIAPVDGESTEGVLQ